MIKWTLRLAVLFATAAMLSAIAGQNARAQMADFPLMEGFRFDPGFPYAPHRGLLLPSNPAVSQIFMGVAFKGATLNGESKVGTGKRQVNGSAYGLAMGGSNFSLSLESNQVNVHMPGNGSQNTLTQGHLTFDAMDYSFGIGGTARKEDGALGTLESTQSAIGFTTILGPFYLGIAKMLEDAQHDYSGTLETGQRTGTMWGVGLRVVPFQHLIRIAFGQEIYEGYDNPLVDGSSLYTEYEVETGIGLGFALGYKVMRRQLRDIRGVANDNLDASGSTVTLGWGSPGFVVMLQSHSSDGKVKILGTSNKLDHNYSSAGLVVYF